MFYLFIYLFFVIYHSSWQQMQRIVIYICSNAVYSGFWNVLLTHLMAALLFGVMVSLRPWACVCIHFVPSLNDSLYEFAMNKHLSNWFVVHILMLGWLFFLRDCISFCVFVFCPLVFLFFVFFSFIYLFLFFFLYLWSYFLHQM